MKNEKGFVEILVIGLIVFGGIIADQVIQMRVKEAVKNQAPVVEIHKPTPAPVPVKPVPYPNKPWWKF